jgi:hypothetical protein
MTDPTSGNEHHTHQFQELYHKNIEALVEAISAALKQATEQTIKGVKKAGEALKSKQSSGEVSKTTEPSIRLFVGGKEVYSQVPGQEPTKNSITPQQFQKIKQALEDPKNLKGAIEIKAGKERIFHARDGEIKFDKLGLAKPQVQKVEATQTTQPSKTAQTSTQPTPPNPEGELKAEITDLKQTVEQQGQRIEALEKKLDALAQSLNWVQNKSLSRWMGSTLSSTAQGLKQAVTGWAVNQGENVRKIQQKAHSAVRATLTTQHPMQQQLQGIENKVQTVSTKFDQGMENVQFHLAVIQQQIKAVQNHPVVQSTTKAAVEKVIEPAVVSMLQRVGVMQNLETLQAQESVAKQESVVNKVKSASSAHQHFKAEEVVAAAEKLLDRIPAQASYGNRSFQTASGYLFERKGEAITISDPQGSELVRSVGRGSERQIHVCERLTAQDAESLEQVGGKIHQDLSPVQRQEQNVSHTQGVARQR